MKNDHQWRIKPPKHPLVVLLKSEWMCEVVIGTAGTVSLFRNGFAELEKDPPNRNWSYGYFAVAAIIVLLVLYRGILKYRERKKVDDHGWLYPFLHYVHDRLLAAGSPNPKSRLRVCLHVPRGDYWYQLTEYVGDDSYGKAGRRFPRKCGILASAACAPGAVVVGDIPAGMEREQYLVETFRFEQHELHDFDEESVSWAAICVGTPPKFHVVIYCDAAVPHFFGKKQASPRRVELKAAARAPARFLANG